MDYLQKIRVNLWKFNFKGKYIASLIITISVFVFFYLWDAGLITSFILPNFPFTYLHVFLFGVEIGSFSLLITILLIISLISVTTNFFSGFLGDTINYSIGMLILFFFNFPFAYVRINLTFPSLLAEFGINIWWFILFLMAYKTNTYLFNTMERLENNYAEIGGEISTQNPFIRAEIKPVPISVKQADGKKTYSFSRDSIKIPTDAIYLDGKLVKTKRDHTRKVKMASNVERREDGQITYHLS